MSSRPSYRCLVVGEGSLLLQCADALLARGHEIVALIAPTGDTSAWCQARVVHRFDADVQLNEAFAGESIDYLFSIVNPRVLGADVCALARRGAINYHDALLPRYAGVHATTWAIMAGEREHGVTWHEITPTVDAGRIYMQRTVPIELNETAFTLDVKCYEAAASSFVQLLEGLEQSTIAPHSQQLEHRSYFARARRPPSAATIDWNQDADAISAFVRALDFGVRPNPIALPKVWVHGTPYVCRVVQPLAELATSAPGTVAAIDDAGLVVASRDRLVRVPSLAMLAGHAVALSLLDVRVGDVLDWPIGRDAASINVQMTQAARFEPMWVERLSDLRAPMLPSMGLRKQNAPDVSGRVPVKVPMPFNDAIAASGEAILLTALAIYLARINEESSFDIAVATEFGANDSDLFMPSFPMRINVDLHRSFGEVAVHLQHCLQERRVQAAIANDVAARYPAAHGAISLPGALGVVVAFDESKHAAVAHNDAALTLLITSDISAASLLFEPRSISHGATVRIARGLEALLADAKANPERSVVELAIMGAAEHAQVVHTWNDTRTDYPRDATIAALFERVATATPHSIAIVQDEGSISYGALNLRANQLAHQLQRLGVGAGTVVGLTRDRSADAILAMLGILKAGGAYLPLDTSSPPIRLAQILADSAAHVVVTKSDSTVQLPSDCELVCIDDPAAKNEPTSAPETNTTAESLAYVMFTSGSTGQPKGVAVTQRGVLRLVCNTSYAHFGSDDVRLGFAPLAFDASTFEIWGALLHGAQLALFPGRASTFELGAFIQRHSVTTAWLTSALFNEMVDSALPTLGGLRQLIAGGDVLSPFHVRRVLRELPECRLINGYGPTENTTFTACYTVPPEWLDNADGAVPIGSPIANTTAYVLDARMQPLPIGVVGELYTGGDGLARGYVNNTRETDVRFVPNPFDRTTRLYATGDLARWRDDGVLEFAGRRDAQIKIRGFRVEPAEVETAMATHSAIRQAAVVAVRDDAGDARLVAFYSLHEFAHEAPSAFALREFLARLLPEHMLPAQYAPLQALPLTAQGKIDRASLMSATLSLVTEVSHAAGVAPTSAMEVTLASIWCEVLGAQYVSAHDDFFMLGGHSLLAMQVLSRVDAQLNVRLPLRVMFDYSTVATLAAHIETVATASGVPRADASQELRTATSGALSPGQEVLWLLQRTMPSLDAYNVAEQWRLEGSVDVDVLDRALTVLIERHAALRTVFTAENGGAVQTIRAPEPFRAEVIAGQLMSESMRDTVLKRIVSRPFELSQDLLLRVTLLRESEVASRLIIVTHHIVDDGWSRTILRRELNELYSAFANGRVPELPQPVLNYVAFAADQRATLTGKVRQRHEDYWRDRLAGWQPTSYVPANRVRPSTMLFDGATVATTISAETTRSIRTLARNSGATPFMVLFAAFQLLLQRYSGERDVVVGTVSASREQREWEDVVGYFATPMAIRTSFDGNPTFTQLIAQVRDEQLRAIEHAALPIELVTTTPSAGAVPQPLPLFRVMCVLQSNAQSELRLGSSVAREVPVATGTAKFDLSLLLTERDSTLYATIEYRTSMFDASTIAKLLEHFDILLQSAVREPTSAVSRLPMISESERRHMLVDWNSTNASLDERCLHELVAEQIARSPDAIAVTDGDSAITYAELGRRVHILARDLMNRGVAPNVLVGGCIERSVQLVVTLLAVLEAGGAYVPLDPDYPPDRLRHMLEDANAAVVITAGGVRDVLPRHGAIAVHLDDSYWHQAATAAGTDDEVRAPTADDLAYVIYTSGSTGRPKGAMNTHRAVCNFVRRSVELHDFAVSDTVLHKTPVSFDPSVWEIFGALTTGARLVLARPRGHADPSYLANVIAEQRVTVMNIVPSMLQALLDVPLFAEQARSLRIIVCGGEVMPPALQTRLFALLPHVRLHNAYGPTETAVNACDWACERNVEHASIPIGRPLPNVHMYCLDEEREPVPPGVVGELYIGGVAVGNGYHGMPALTAERFIEWPNPSRTGAAERLYRTGDLARMDADGVIEYVGRRDHQIKLRGVRIELGEIEAALATHPSLRAATVILRDDAPGADKRLVAYVVPRAGATVTDRALRDHCRGILLDAMVPAAFVTLAELPIAPTGKIDRDALPVPSYERLDDDAFIAPHTATEVSLAALVIDVLGISRVGAHDNFFEIGGHSLAAMSVVSRALNLGIPLSVTDLFDNPTVAALANIVDARQAAGVVTKPSSMAIPRVARAAYRRVFNE